MSGLRRSEKSLEWKPEAEARGQIQPTTWATGPSASLPQNQPMLFLRQPLRGSKVLV